MGAPASGPASAAPACCTLRGRMINSPDRRARPRRPALQVLKAVAQYVEHVKKHKVRACVRGGGRAAPAGPTRERAPPALPQSRFGPGQGRQAVLSSHPQLQHHGGGTAELLLPQPCTYRTWCHGGWCAHERCMAAGMRGRSEQHAPGVATPRTPHRTRPRHTGGEGGGRPGKGGRTGGQPRHEQNGVQTQEQAGQDRWTQQRPRRHGEVLSGRPGGGGGTRRSLAQPAGGRRWQQCSCYGQLHACAGWQGTPGPCCRGRGWAAACGEPGGAASRGQAALTWQAPPQGRGLPADCAPCCHVCRSAS